MKLTTAELVNVCNNNLQANNNNNRWKLLGRRAGLQAGRRTYIQIVRQAGRQGGEQTDDSWIDRTDR